VYGFLLRPRWLGLALAVLVLATVCVRLGFWQLSRLDERLAENSVIEHNLATDPVPAGSLAGAGEPVSDSDQWRPVTATGSYDVGHQLLVRYQANAGARGVDVLVPLVGDDGTAVLVDRGFWESPSGTPDASAVPPPPTGTVTVTGWLRQDSTASSDATVASDGTVRAVSSATLSQSLPYPVRGGWVMAREESPPPDQPLAGPELPELDSGPHFFYAMQWFFFALLAVAGYCYFSYDEAHPARRRAGPRRTGSEDDGSPSPAGAGTRRAPS
jgi:cytochrome oxidase assembly protein ShyY1